MVFRHQDSHHHPRLSWWGTVAMNLGVALVRANVWASSNCEGSKKPLSHTVRSYARPRGFANTPAHTPPDRRHIHHLVTPRYHEERQTHSARYIYTFATQRRLPPNIYTHTTRCATTLPAENFPHGYHLPSIGLASRRTGIEGMLSRWLYVDPVSTCKQAVFL